MEVDPAGSDVPDGVTLVADRGDIAGQRFDLEAVELEEALPALETSHRRVTTLVDLAETMAAAAGADAGRGT